MIDRQKRFTARAAKAVPLMLGLGVAGIAISGGKAGSTGEPVRCEIQTSSMNGMTALEGVVHADVAVSGSYRFQVSSSGGAGGSDISQGGTFAAGPDGAVTLGKVMLGNAGAIYNASLVITSDGMTVECEERVGGQI